MAESTFRIPSTITIDNIVMDASSPIDGEVLIFNGTSFVADSIVPVGTIEMWAGLSSSIPSGWLLCDGGQYAIGASGSQYYALSQIITTRYGSYTNGSGVAGSSHFVVPTMTAYVPFGITSGTTSTSPAFLATTSSFAETSLAHNHTTDTSATTNADGSNHSHTLADTGSHRHTLPLSNWNHYHDTGTPSTTHRHTIPAGNTAQAYSTGNTAHTSTQHTDFTADNAQIHAHTTGIQTTNADHTHSIPTSTGLAHVHTFPNSSTSNPATATAHNHTQSIVPICFIIKF